MIKMLVRLGVFTGSILLLLCIVQVAGRTVKNPIQGMFSETVLPDGQTLTCWHGICPGQTTVDEATRILQADPTLSPVHQEWTSPCWESHSPYYAVCLDIQHDNLT